MGVFMVSGQHDSIHRRGHLKELLCIRELQFARVCAQYFTFFFFVHHRIYFKDDKTAFREVQYLVQGHAAKREIEQLLNHESDFKIHVHNH